MSAIKILRTDSFVGGLNMRADPFQLGEDESPDMLNIDIDPRGGLAMRGGVERLNTSAIGAIGAGLFTPRAILAWMNGTTPNLLVSANSLVYYATTTSFTSTTIAPSSTWGASMASFTGRIAAGTPLSNVYMAIGNGTQSQKWNGTANTAMTVSAAGAWQESLATPTGTHMPKADLCASHADRLWVASTNEDGTAYPNRIRYSHPFYPESWRSLDFIDVVGGGSGITALVPFNGTLLIFKRNSIHVLHGYDTDSFQLVQLTNTIGVPSPQCVAATESSVVFFSWPQGLFSYNGTDFDDLFIPLRPLVQLSTISETATAQIYVSMINRRIWLSVPEGSDTTPTSTYILDPTLGENGAWTRMRLADGRGVACGCDYVASTGTRYPIALHPIQPYALRVDRAGVYKDDITGTPTNFTSYYVTRWHDAGVVSQRKMWRRPDFIVKQPSVLTPLTIEVYQNWEESDIRRTMILNIAAAGTGMVWTASAGEPDGVAGWSEANWGASAAGSQFEKGSNLGLARSVQLKISGPGALPWGINSISYKYNPRPVR